MAITGADDRIWPSPGWARQLDAELAARTPPAAHRALIYPDAGHQVGTYPYRVALTTARDPITGELLSYGGTRAANDRAQVDGWRAVLAVLHGLQATP